MVLPEIEQKIIIFQRQTEQKFALIDKSAECISNQFDHAINGLTYPQNAKSDFKFFELNEKELIKLDKNLLILLKKVDFSRDLQCLMEGFCNEIMKSLEKHLECKILDTLNDFSNKINKITNAVSIIEMKRDMKKELMEKKENLKGKQLESDFKNSTFGKNDWFQNDKENQNTGNRILKNNEKPSMDFILR